MVSTTFPKPKNIVLSEDEETNLLLTFGPEKVRRMLLLVSVYKTEQGGTLKTSDFANCVKWASMKVDAQDQQARREADSSAPATNTRPAYPTTSTHVTTTNKPFRELT
ncbi:hypothetical protein [Spirosoma foliorum]|uniref:Uncharacterized protein n=1 Tax=Spirosoma foliorum TaxID=2710596 RepID=A0A7G5H5D7_9BACT|nr:hypothetical protein [Spirosoma foliorum]QMW06329.1 hypothetical protein H3H32_16285 [Spirosoma foliorum]